MIRYRPFRNSDPPAIAEIWRSHPPLRRLVPFLSPAQFEQHVLSKPYFDREGLIVAVDDERPIGFAHAGFGSRDDGGDLRREIGVICRVMVAQRDDRAEIAGELLARAEAYLLQRGAQSLLAGGLAPHDPFYLGMYGGSELPGVLAGDAFALELFRRAGYAEADRRLVLQIELAQLRAVVNRQQMQIRRGYNVETALDPPPATWWDACTLGQMERTRFSLAPRSGGGEVGGVTFWNIDPLSASWGVRAAGIVRLEIAPQTRRQGLATFLLGESLKQLHAQGIALVEVHVGQADAPAASLFRKLGFAQVDEAFVLRKSVDGRMRG